MRHVFGKTIVIALGGSIMYHDSIDHEFLKAWKGFVTYFVKREYQLVIVTGGGRSSRLYQEAASKITKVSDEDKDWIGIHATRTNAHLLRTVLSEYADPVVIDERKKLKKLKYPVTIAS